MRELRTIEVESNCSFRAVPRVLQPDELRPRIDESLDQPRTGQPVRPGSRAGRPDAGAESFRCLSLDATADRVRLVGRKNGVGRRGKLLQGLARLLARRTGEEILQRCRLVLSP